MVNLIQNSKDSLLSDENKNNPNKCIQILTEIDSKKIRIIVMDNGTGISEENMKKIFSYGFSTKTYGHGIGLHSCAIAAKDLGGRLIVESDGVGKGAKFILEIPRNEKI